MRFHKAEAGDEEAVDVSRDDKTLPVIGNDGHVQESKEAKSEEEGMGE